MRKIAFSVASLAMVAILAGCSSDIILEPPPSLSGEYHGQYIIEERSGSQVVENKQFILWRFTDQTWDMDVDLTKNTDFCICEPYGRYALEDRVRLTVDASSPLGELCTACIEDLNPTGSFQIDRSTDTLVLTQLTQTGDGESVTKQIRLLPVTTNGNGE